MSSFLQQVNKQFNEAKENKELISFDSTVVEKQSGGLKFELTLAPALGQKPIEKKDDKEGEQKPTEKKDDKEKQKPNPFLNPSPALVVKELEEHTILLNKFSVTPNHLIIITKEFKKQTEPLLPNDLYESFKVLKEFGPYQPAVAFYNCGELSGASQGHKHVQVLPLKLEGTQPPIKTLYDEIYDRHIGQIYAINKLPFVHVIMALDSNIIRAATAKDELTDYLGQMFFGLLDAMFQQLRENARPMSTSYNFLMTQDFMMLIPRSKESATVEHEDKTFEMSINSLGFAGLLLCKTEEQLKALEAQENLLDLLAQVGVQWDPEAAKYEAARNAAAASELA